jgi:hypothetical protein
MMRAAMCTAMPCTSPSAISTSPVCRPARISRPRSSTASRIAHAQLIARAGPSKVASAPSGELDECAARAGHVPFDDAVVRGQGRRPRLIAQLRRAFG